MPPNVLYHGTARQFLESINVNGQRCFAKGEVRGATIEEIKALGWDKFIVNTKE